MIFNSSQIWLSKNKKGEMNFSNHKNSFSVTCLIQLADELRKKLYLSPTSSIRAAEILFLFFFFSPTKVKEILESMRKWRKKIEGNFIYEYYRQ